MADTQTPPAAILSPRDEARLQLAATAARLSDQARALVPVEPDPAPGTLLAAALELRDQVNQVIAAAAVAERERGVTWEQLAKATGMARQSAHQNWHRAITAWAENGRRTDQDPSGRALAQELDAWVACDEPDRTDAVSAGLDAVRFPGSDAYENHQRTTSQDLHTRLQEALAAKDTAWKAMNDLELADDDSGIDHPVNHAVVAALEELIATYEELAGAEPALADDHRASADWLRPSAQRFREEGINPQP
ncbi:hypothetical protein ABZ791_30295 [Streptomyces huasconensis]|uniref:Uncharacterized protein n=1 Tax=Streptomyces huasconensis TaxID=1854574 RepID=A0ABV3M1N6_9ACTN